MGLLVSINGADFRPLADVRRQPPAVRSPKGADTLTPLQRQLDHPDSFEKLLENYQKDTTENPYEQQQKEGELHAPARHAVHAQDLMTSPVKTLSETALASEAKTLLGEHSFRHLPIVDEEGKIVGMTSDRSFLTASDEAPLSEVMNRDLLIAEPQTLLTEIIEGLLQMKVHSVPIVDVERHPIGIVTSSDLLRSLLKNPNIDLWA